MTDTTQTPSGIPAGDSRAHNKNLIFAALAEAGILRPSTSITTDPAIPARSKSIRGLGRHP